MNENDLVRLRSKVVDQLASLETIAATARAAVKESSEVIPNFLQHESDAAKGGTDLENAMTVHGHCTAQQGLLKNALLRMGRAEFGLCQDCGHEINLRRLEAMPGATRCILCQEEGELKMVSTARPLRLFGYPQSWWAA